MAGIEGWSEFNVAIIGAAGALAGLVIVALSVNISRIVESRAIIDRAGAAITALLLAVVVCAVGLIPNQPAWAYGIEVVLAGVGGGWFGVRATIAISADPAPSARARVAKSALALAPAALLTAAGIAALAGAPALSLGLVAAGTLLAIVAGVVIAWVALVEVLR